MKLNLKKIVKKHNIRLIIVDIDGTVKDLYKEHKEALKKTFKALRIHRTKRVKFAMWLNKLGMAFFKVGCLPTNVTMQTILLHILSTVTLNEYDVVKELYYSYYPKTSLLFEEMKQELQSVSQDIKIVLASTNHYTLTVKQELCEDFGVKELRKKIYQNILKSEKIKPSKVLVIGDNFFDDYIPAKRLGCKVYLVNNYNSWLKEGIIKLTNK